MVNQASERGAIGRHVAANVKRIRDGEKRWTYVDLSNRLADQGRHIPPLGIRRIEEGIRRVDVDDLYALAAALETTVNDLTAPVGVGDRAKWANEMSATVIEQLVDTVNRLTADNAAIQKALADKGIEVP